MAIRYNLPPDCNVRLEDGPVKISFRKSTKNCTPSAFSVYQDPYVETLV